MTPQEAVAVIAAVRYRLIDVAEAHPELGLLMDRAVEDIDLAGRVLMGDVELNACPDCGLTVEDGECPTGGNCDMQEAYNAS